MKVLHLADLSTDIVWYLNSTKIIIGNWATNLFRFINVGQKKELLWVFLKGQVTLINNSHVRSSKRIFANYNHIWYSWESQFVIYSPKFLLSVTVELGNVMHSWKIGFLMNFILILLTKLENNLGQIVQQIQCILLQAHQYKCPKIVPGLRSYQPISQVCLYHWFKQ